MAFTTSDSYTADNANNNLRGLNKDNSDNAHTGDTDETNLATFAMTGGTMGTTGSLHIIAAGTTTGTTDTKTAKFVFGSLTVATIAIASGATTDWMFDVWIYNTATNAQRIVSRSYEGTATLEGFDYQTHTQDTTASVTIKCTGTMGGTTDTITQTLFDTDIVQRT